MLTAQNVHSLRTVPHFPVPEPALTPPEPPSAGRCAYCGDELYAGEQVYVGDEGRLHRECVVPLILETLSVGHLAALCGYREAIA